MVDAGGSAVPDLPASCLSGDVLLSWTVRRAGGTNLRFAFVVPLPEVLAPAAPARWCAMLIDGEKRDVPEPKGASAAKKLEPALTSVEPLGTGLSSAALGPNALAGMLAASVRASVCATVRQGQLDETLCYVSFLRSPRDCRCLDDGGPLRVTGPHP